PNTSSRAARASATPPRRCWSRPSSWCWWPTGWMPEPLARSKPEAIEPRRRAGEEGCLLVGGIALGHVLEGVPERAVGAGKGVDREVALEHATLGAERLDAALDVGPPFFGQLRRGRRRVGHERGETGEHHG